MITNNKDKPTIREVRGVIDDATLRESVADTLSRGIGKGHIIPYSREANSYISCVRYLMCMLAFDHFQRPGVAQAMTVYEFDKGQWLEGRYIIGVRKHKRSGTGASHMYPAVVSLTRDDHTLFAQYRTKVRRPMADETMEMTDDALFFTTLGGKGYTNASSEIDKMQRKCGVRRVSSNAARHWMETINRYGTTADQDGIGAYLTHSSEVVKVQVNHAIITMERLVREVRQGRGSDRPGPSRR